MATIRTAVQIYDGVTGPVKSMTKAMDICISSFEAMQTASNHSVDNSALIQARAELTKANGQIEEIENNMNRAAQAQRRVTSEVHNSSAAADGLWSKVKGIAATIGGMMAVQKVIGISDQMAGAEARLSLIVDDGGSVAELEKKIMASAQRSRAAYLGVVDSVSKLGLTAGKSFENNDEMIKFAELMNKNFVIAGASAQAQSSAMYQLNQAMGSGRLQGDEYRAIIENAPLLANAIESYMRGIGMEGTMKEWSADGLLTAEVIKNALFSSADEVEARFATMPMTWGQVWNSFSNIVLFALRPVLAGINWLANNIGIVGPMVLGLGAAFLVFQVAAHWTQIAAAATAIYHAVVAFLSIGFGVLTGSTAAASAAVFTFNSALLASPITWIIMIMAVLIGALYAGVSAFNKNADAAVSATGIIMGAIYTLGAHIFNTFLVPVQNGIASLVNFFANAWNDPVAAVQVLFYDMVLTIIGYIRNMASAIENVINKIPGVTIDITSGLDNFYSGLEAAQRKVKDQSGWIEVMGKMDYWAYDDAAKAGYAMGQAIDDKVSKMFDFDGTAGGGMDFSGMYDQVANIAGNTAAINDTLDISEESLEWLVDIAGREAINRFTTAEIHLEMGGVTNNLGSDMDIDGVINTMAEEIMGHLNEYDPLAD